MGVSNGLIVAPGVTPGAVVGVPVVTSDVMDGVAPGVESGVTGRLVISGVGVISGGEMDPNVAVAVIGSVLVNGTVAVSVMASVTSNEGVNWVCSPGITVITTPELLKRGFGSTIRSTAKNHTVPVDGPFPQPTGP